MFTRRSALSMNFFDNLKVIFSKEGQENIKAFNDKEKEESLAAQKEILARRANPKLMREYEAKRDANIQKLAEERAVYKFQGTVKEGKSSNTHIVITMICLQESLIYILTGIHNPHNFKIYGTYC